MSTTLITGIGELVTNDPARAEQSGLLGLVTDASTTEVLRHADAALYEAKRDGRGRLHVFDPAAAETAFDGGRLEIES